MCPGYSDWDIEVAMFSIIAELATKLMVECPLPEATLEHFKVVARNRKEVCEKIMGVYEVKGKEMLNMVSNGGEAPASHPTNPFLDGLKKESVFIR